MGVEAVDRLLQRLRIGRRERLLRDGRNVGFKVRVRPLASNASHRWETITVSVRGTTMAVRTSTSGVERELRLTGDPYDPGRIPVLRELVSLNSKARIVPCTIGGVQHEIAIVPDDEMFLRRHTGSG